MSQHSSETRGNKHHSCVLVCRQPPHCVPETYTNATSWYKVFTTVRDSDTKYSQDYNPFWCYKGAIGKVYHALNPKLTVIVPDVSHHLLIFWSQTFLRFILLCLCTGESHGQRHNVGGLLSNSERNVSGMAQRTGSNSSLTEFLDQVSNIVISQDLSGCRLTSS